MAFDNIHAAVPQQHAPNFACIVRGFLRCLVDHLCFDSRLLHRRLHRKPQLGRLYSVVERRARLRGLLLLCLRERLLDQLGLQSCQNFVGNNVVDCRNPLLWTTTPSLRWLVALACRATHWGPFGTPPRRWHCRFSERFSAAVARQMELSRIQLIISRRAHRSQSLLALPIDFYLCKGNPGPHGPKI